MTRRLSCLLLGALLLAGCAPSATSPQTPPTTAPVSPNDPPLPGTITAPPGALNDAAKATLTVTTTPAYQVVKFSTGTAPARLFLNLYGAGLAVNSTACKVVQDHIECDFGVLKEGVTLNVYARGVLRAEARYTRTGSAVPYRLNATP